MGGCLYLKMSNSKKKANKPITNGFEYFPSKSNVTYKGKAIFKVYFNKNVPY